MGGEEEQIDEYSQMLDMPLFKKFYCPKCKTSYKECQSNKRIRSGEIEYMSTKMIVFDDYHLLQDDRMKFQCPSCGYTYIMVLATPF
jgi:predicted RNA-binding Zn-ribbon protein involved in translation (DUF1610 family)